MGKLIVPDFLRRKAEPIEFKTDLDSAFFRNLRQYEGGRYSVTSILWIVSNWEFLDKIFAWLSKEVSKKAMANWTKLHEDIENSYNAWKFILWTSNNKNAWLKFYTEQGCTWKSIIQEEKLLWDRQGWTVDAIMEVDWKITIIDWKTAKSLPGWQFLNKYKMQLWIYCRMWEQKHWKQIQQWKIAVFMRSSYKVLEYSREELETFIKDFDTVADEFFKLKTKHLTQMKLTTNVNQSESVTIEWSSIITWRNWSGKSSILNSVEMSLYWTINGVRPKVKGTAEFESEYSFKAKELPLQSIIYARFLDQSPIAKKKTLLNLIVDEEIKWRFGDFWDTDIEKSIKAVQDRAKTFKKSIEAADTKMSLLEEQNESDETSITMYPENIEVDFDFKDVESMAVNLNSLEASMSAREASWKSLIANECSACKQKLPEDENSASMLDQIKKEYSGFKKEREELWTEYEAAIEHNKWWEQAAKNKVLLAEKNMYISNINKRNEQTQQLVEELVDTKKDWVFAVETYIKNELYWEISKKFSLKDFEIDLSWSFKLKYKWVDFDTMSRWQKYTANVYFSVWLLRQLDCRILMLDDIEMLNQSIQDEIIKEIKDFDYLIAIVDDNDLTVK